MPSNHFNVGLIVPSSNTVMEPDFHRELGARCVISTSRVYLEQVTREAEEVMINEELPKAVRLVKTADPTSSSSAARPQDRLADWKATR